MPHGTGVPAVPGGGTLARFGAQQMTSARSPEQRARLSRESGLDLNRFDSVTTWKRPSGLNLTQGCPNTESLRSLLQSSSLPIYQFTNLSVRCVTQAPGRP